MIGATSLLLALGLGGAIVPVADFDIPYFLNNPQIHEETLRRCHNDERLAMTPECENAERAGTRRIGRPLSSRAQRGKIPGLRVAPVPTPKVRDHGA